MIKYACSFNQSDVVDYASLCKLVRVKGIYTELLDYHYDAVIAGQLAQRSPSKGHLVLAEL